MIILALLWELVGKFIRFGLVGLSGIFIDFGTTWILKNKLGINKYIANGIGFTAAASSNYFLNRIWTFQSNNPELMNEYLKFYLVSLIGLALNTSIIWLINGKRKKNFWIAKLMATALVMIWNFIANLLFTFN